MVMILLAEIGNIGGGEDLGQDVMEMASGVRGLVVGDFIYLCMHMYVYLTYI